MSNYFFCNECKKQQPTTVDGGRVICSGCGFTLCLTTTPRISNRPKSSPSGRPTKIKNHQQAYGTHSARIQTLQEERLQSDSVLDGATPSNDKLDESLSLRKRSTKKPKRKQRNLQQTRKKPTSKSRRTSSK